MSAIGDALADLAAAGSVTLHDPADLFSDAMLDVSLPADHVRVLARSNGIEGYAGYLRLFAVGGDAGIELRRWNDRGLWRAAWGGRANGWLCFGETGWGDQYAYREGEPAGRVFRLDAFSMEAEPVADGFSEFMRTVFLPWSARPRDELTIAVRRRLGRLPLAEHVTLLPPPMDGDLDPSRVVRMPAAAAMVANARASRVSAPTP
jgi:hypothetical protein